MSVTFQAGGKPFKKSCSGPTLKEVFTFMRGDNKFISKCVLFFILVLLSEVFTALTVSPFFIVGLIGIALLFVTSGYYMNVIASLTIQKENYVLPTINFGSNFIVGLKYLVGILLFVVSTSLAAVLLSIVTKPLAPIVPILIMLIFICFWLYYLPAMLWNFANKGNVLSFFLFKKAAQIVSVDSKKYICCLGMFLLVSIVLVVVSVILSIIISLLFKNVIGAILQFVFCGLLVSYMTFINAYITAKAISPECLNS